MESGQKPRKSFTSLFKRKEQASQTPLTTASQSEKGSPASGVPGSPDRQRTKARYLGAVKALEEAIKGHEKQWGSYDFPELGGEFENFNTPQLKDKISEALEARERQMGDRKAWGKFRHAIECVFTAFTPFARNFITIAKEVQSVIVVL